MLLFRHLIAGLLVAFAVAGGAGVGHAATDVVCYRDWSEAGPVVRAENLRSVRQILKSVEREGVGKVLKIKLCKHDDSTYFYKVTVSAAGGTVSWLLVDAQTGRIQPLVRP